MFDDLKATMKELLDEEAEDTAARRTASTNVAMAKNEKPSPAEEPAADNPPPPPTSAEVEGTDSPPARPGDLDSSPSIDPPAAASQGEQYADAVQPDEIQPATDFAGNEIPFTSEPPAATEIEPGEAPAVPETPENEDQAQEIPFVDIEGRVGEADDQQPPISDAGEVQASENDWPQVAELPPVMMPSFQNSSGHSDDWSPSSFGEPFDMELQSEETAGSPDEIDEAIQGSNLNQRIARVASAIIQKREAAAGGSGAGLQVKESESFQKALAERRHKE